MKLTTKQIKDYNEDPNHCPYCGEGFIIGDSFDMDSGCVTQEVTCEDCGESWVDEYEFVGIMLEDEDA